jgi:alanyl-tRNA synthetase
LLGELAEFQAKQLLVEAAPVNGRKIVKRMYADHDLAYIRLLAQKLTRTELNVVALLATSSDPVSLVFAQSKGLPFDMAALLKETVLKMGGGGGGSKDMAQGGVPTAANLGTILADLGSRLASQL